VVRLTASVSTSPIDLTSSVEIYGATGSETLSSSGGTDTSGSDRIFYINTAGITLKLRDLTMTNPGSTKRGCIHQRSTSSTIIAEDVTFEDCDTLGWGAAIYADGGSISLTRVKFTDNGITGGAGIGGAVYVWAPTSVTMDTVCGSGNFAGNGGKFMYIGASNSGSGQVTVTNSWFASDQNIQDQRGGWVTTTNPASSCPSSAGA
jgi:hypothetical protein